MAGREDRPGLSIVHKLIPVWRRIGMSSSVLVVGIDRCVSGESQFNG